MTGKAHYEEKAATLAKAFSSHEKGTPSQNTMFLTVLGFFVGPAYELVIVGGPNSKETEKVLHAIRTRFVPNKVMLLKKENDTRLENVAGFTKNMKTIAGKTAAYICQNFICSKPMTDINEVSKILAHSSNR